MLLTSLIFIKFIKLNHKYDDPPPLASSKFNDPPLCEGSKSRDPPPFVPTHPPPPRPILIPKPSSIQPRAPKRQLSVGDPVLFREYRKSHNPWTKGVIISKLGPVTYRVQVEDFIWKRHIDQLKDLSGTKIQAEAGEVTEDLLLQPRQAQPAVEPVLPKDYFCSPPQAKDYPKLPPQAKLQLTQNQEPVREATASAKDFPEPRNQQLNHQFNHPSVTHNVLGSRPSV